jgi:hypothetical protein
MYLNVPDLPDFEQDSNQGQLKDLAFLAQDAWVHNTEVCYRIVPYQGRFHLYMVFIAVETPLRFLVRKIDDYHSEQKALIYAEIFQRGIRKDARGVLKTNRNAFDICLN